jgi:hypothetical protein
LQHNITERDRKIKKEMLKEDDFFAETASKENPYYTISVFSKILL